MSDSLLERHEMAVIINDVDRQVVHTEKSVMFRLSDGCASDAPRLDNYQDQASPGSDGVIASRYRNRLLEN